MAQPSDAAIQAMLRRAVRSADRAAGADDAAFLAELRSQVHAPARARAAGGGALGLAAPKRARGARLEDDPRYLAAVRALARRGASNARIVGGSAVRGTEFHDCVAVGTDDDWGCTGTLIRPNVVLTAAHCEEYHTRVFIGNDVGASGRVIRVARAIPHSRWTDAAFRSDLMLLVLEKKAPATVKPRKLAAKAQIDAAVEARVVGFGSTDIGGYRGYGIKRKTDVPIVSSACRGKVGRQSDGSVYGCHAKTMCGDGGLYVRVDAYRAWIASMIARYAR
jgi:hypothetical protein